METAASDVPEAQRGVATCPWPCSCKGTGCPGDPLAESEHMLAEEHERCWAAPAARPRATHAATSPVPSVPSAAPGRTAAPRLPCPAPWPPASSQPALPPRDPVPAAFSGQAPPSSQAGAMPAARSALGAGCAPGHSFSGPPRACAAGWRGVCPTWSLSPQIPQPQPCPSVGTMAAMVPGLVQCLWGPLTPSLALLLGPPRWGNQGT